MPDGSEIGFLDDDDRVRDAARSTIARREVGEVLVFEFDFGDSWLHRCSVLEAGVPVRVETTIRRPYVADYRNREVM
jgi:hypothetical protein